MNAICWPSGEMRTPLTQPTVLWSTLPTGYSSRIIPSFQRATASCAPSGLQSAACTSCSSSRAAPPIGGTRASVPRRLEPLAGHLLDAAPHQRGEAGALALDLGREARQVVAHDRGHGLDGRAAVERRRPGGQLVQHAAEREDVGALVGGLAAHLL